MNYARVWSSFSLELSLLLWWLVCYGALVLGFACALMLIAHLSFVLFLVYFSTSLLLANPRVLSCSYLTSMHSTLVCSSTTAKYFLLGYGLHVALVFGSCKCL